MTLKDFSRAVHNRYVFQDTKEDPLARASRYATELAREVWPEVDYVEARYSDNSEYSIVLTFCFVSDQDKLWWALKNA